MQSKKVLGDILGGLKQVNQGEYAYTRIAGLLSLIKVISQFAEQSKNSELDQILTQSNINIVETVLNRELDDQSSTFAPHVSATEQQRALELFEGIALCSDVARNQLAFHQVMQIASRLLKTKSLGVKRAAIDMLIPAVLFSQDICHQFVETDGVKTLVGLTKDHEAHSSLREKSVELLFVIIRFCTPLPPAPATTHRDLVARWLGVKMTLELIKRTEFQLNKWHQSSPLDTQDLFDMIDHTKRFV
eukprot:c27106_g1_i1.p1 GENE.c27106_g1_i1~~c27106_g1_i1.p1  ORF type:complete len:246 (+),score=51.34 c27106_g1_i1:34-771(+)